MHFYTVNAVFRDDILFQTLEPDQQGTAGQLMTNRTSVDAFDRVITASRVFFRHTVAVVRPGKYAVAANKEIYDFVDNETRLQPNVRAITRSGVTISNVTIESETCLA